MNGAAHPVIAVDSHPQVLIVEDQRSSRNALCKLLNISGFTTASAASAEDALLYLSESPCPAIALVDLDLPGMSGVDLIARLRQTTSHLYVYLLTAANFDRVRSVLRDPTVVYIQKPIQFDELLSLLRQTSREIARWEQDAAHSYR